METGGGGLGRTVVEAAGTADEGLVKARVIIAPGSESKEEPAVQQDQHHRWRPQCALLVRPCV